MRTELAIGSVTLLAVVMQLLTIHTGEVIITLSLTVHAVLYGIFGFFHLNGITIVKLFKSTPFAGVTPRKGIFAFVAGWVMAILCASVLFKMTQLVGTSEMLFLAITSGFPLLILTSVSFLIRKTPFKLGIIKRLVIWGVVIGIITPISEVDMVRFMFRDAPAYVEAFIQAKANPDDEDLKKQAEQMRFEIVYAEN